MVLGGAAIECTLILLDRFDGSAFREWEMVSSRRPKGDSSGDVDQILAFTTLEGVDVKLPTMNASSIVFRLEDLVVPQ